MRRYRRRDAAPSDQQSQVQSTLLEYGQLRSQAVTSEHPVAQSEVNMSFLFGINNIKPC